MVNIKGLDKAKVLKALYDNSKAQRRVSFLPLIYNDEISLERCRELLEQGTYIDYLCGRVIKVDLGEDEFEERLYDRDNGPGAAQRAIDSIRREVAK